MFIDTIDLYHLVYTVCDPHLDWKSNDQRNEKPFD